MIYVAPIFALGKSELNFSLTFHIACDANNDRSGATKDQSVPNGSFFLRSHEWFHIEHTPRASVLKKKIENVCLSRDGLEQNMERREPLDN